MKKILWSAVILASLLGLPGCASVPVNLGDGYLLGQDDQYYFDRNVQLQAMAETEDGYYFFSGPDSAFLYYIDRETMKPVILCNKPDCLHTDETDPFKIANCNACLYANNMNMVYYNSYLYVGGTDHRGVYSIYQTSLDGTQKKKIHSFKDEPESWLIHRGYIYFTVNDNGTLQGQEANTTSSCKLYRMDISHIKNGQYLLYEISGVYESTIRLFGYGNGVYWLATGFDNTMTKIEYEAIQYEILDGQIRLLGNDITYISACRGKLIFRCTDGVMYKSDQDGSNKERIGKIGNDGFIYCDGYDYIYCDTLPQKTAYAKHALGNKNVRSLLVYDLQGTLISTINIDSIGNDWCFGGNGDFFFIPDNRSKSNEYGDIRILWAIDKKMIENGSLALEKVFEFIPKTQFPGIAVEIE